MRSKVLDPLEEYENKNVLTPPTHASVHLYLLASGQHERLVTVLDTAVL
jgi:hypothetical protein